MKNEVVAQGGGRGPVGPQGELARGGTMSRALRLMVAKRFQKTPNKPVPNVKPVVLLANPMGPPRRRHSAHSSSRSLGETSVPPSPSANGGGGGSQPLERAKTGGHKEHPLANPNHHTIGGVPRPSVSLVVPSDVPYRMVVDVRWLYQITDTIKHGEVSNVLRGRSRERAQDCALKLFAGIRNGPRLKEDVEREIRALAAASSSGTDGAGDEAHVARLVEVVQTPQYVCFVTELVPGGQLGEFLARLGSFPEPVAQRVFARLVAAVHSVHRAGLVHGSLSPDNILLDRTGPSTYVVKLVDFGNAHFVNSKRPPSRARPGDFTAPEVADGVLGLPNDVWSLGVLLHVMLNGTLPFQEEGRWCKGDELAEDVKRLVEHMLHTDPGSRPSIDDVAQHPWVARAISAPVAEGESALERFAATQKFRTAVFVALAARRVDYFTATPEGADRWMRFHSTPVPEPPRSGSA